MPRGTAALATVALLVAGSTDPAHAQPQITVDHFLLYGVKVNKRAPKFVKLGPVDLADAFGLSRADIVQVKALGVPGDKNQEGLLDPTTHLVEYRLKRSRRSAKFVRRKNVRIVNQCSDVRLEVKKPVSLMVPSVKCVDEPAGTCPTPLPTPDPETHDIDHFLCYQARLQKKLDDGTRLPKFPKGVQVEVADQFQMRRYDLKKITKLCHAVAKSGAPLILGGPDKGSPFPLSPAPVEHPDAALVCYQAKAATKTIAQSGCGPALAGDKGTKIAPKQPKHVKRVGLAVANQLGSTRLDTKKELELCIPSERIIPTPVPTPGALGVWVVDVTSCDAVEVSAGAPPLPAGYFWAPDGLRVRFASTDGNTYHVDRDGTGRVPALAGFIAPDWSLVASNSGGASGSTPGPLPLTVQIAPTAGGSAQSHALGNSYRPGGWTWAPDSSAFAQGFDNVSNDVDGDVVFDRLANPIDDVRGVFLTFVGGTQGPNPRPGNGLWSPDSAVLLDSLTRQSDGSTGTWTHAPGEVPVKVSDRNGLVAWHPSGDQFAVAPSAGGLYLVPRAGGADDEIVAPSGLRFATIAVSPDGVRAGGRESVVVTGPPPFPPRHLFLVELDGSHLRRISSDPSEFAVLVGWTPNGSRLLWTERTSDGNTSLILADGDGSSPSALAGPVDTTALGFAQWSPDGTSVLYVGPAPTCAPN